MAKTLKELMDAVDGAVQDPTSRKHFKDLIALTWATSAEAARGESKCACVDFDDGSRFELGSFAGGAAPNGAFSYVRCIETTPDGTKLIHHYVRDSVTKA